MHWKLAIAALLAASGPSLVTSSRRVCPPKPVPIRDINFADIGGEDIHGYELHGNARIVEPAPEGIPRALRIDSKFSYALIKGVDIGPANLPEVTLTVSAYIESIRPCPGCNEAAQVNSYGWVISHDNGGWDRAIFLHDERFKGMGLTSGQFPKSKFNLTPTLQKWIHIIGVWRQGGECALFIENQRVPFTQTVIGRNNEGLPDVAIGAPQQRRFGKGNDNDLWVKDVKIFDYALDDDEIQSLDCHFEDELDPTIDCGNGGDLVYSCTDCVSGDGSASGCMGDCMWDPSTGACTIDDGNDISCGDHDAADCSQCDSGADGSGCSGECKFADGECRPFDWEPPVDCGTFEAATCAECPSGDGASGCAGECMWDPSTGECTPDDGNDVSCGDHDAADCSQCDVSADGSSGCSGECKFADGECRPFDWEAPVDPIPEPPACTPTNVALGGVASQSSNYSNGGAASLAIDGNVANNWSSKSMSHTSANSRNPWWKVKFNRSTISSVVVVNRKDCCSDRMVGFIMEIFDGSKKVYSSAESNRAESATNKQTYFYKGFNVVGDSVKIRLEKNVPLHLAEVFVMGCPDTTKPTPVPVTPKPTPVPAATCSYKRDTWIVTNKDVAIRSVSSRNYLDGRAPSNNDAWLTNRPPKNDKYLNWRLVPVPGASETYVYGLKSISSNKFLDGRNRSFASKNGSVLVTPGNPQTNKYLQWKVENMGNGAYALRSISSGLYLDGRNPNHLGNQVWLTPRKPQGDKYLQWHFETCQGGSTPKPTPVTPKPTPINCGYGKTASSCGQCVVGGSPAGCSGSCAWSNSGRKCVPKPPGGIYQCGDHQASSCGQCGISPNIKLTGMYYTNTYVPDSHEILNVGGPIGAVQRYDLRKMRGDRHVPKGQVSIQVWTNASASIKSRIRNHLIKNVTWRNKYCANAHPRHPAQIQVAGIGFTRRSWVPGYVILFSQTQFIFISTDNRFQMPFTRATDAQKRQWIR